MATVWPFSPASPLTESLIFKTDIRQSAEGEFRDSLHAGAIEYQIKHHELDHVAAKMEQLFRENPLGDWTVPQWPEMTRYSGTLAEGEAFIYGVNQHADYRVGTGTAIVWKDHDAWELVDVAALSGDTLELSSGLSTAYAGSERDPVVIAPVITCLASRPLNIAVGSTLVSGSLIFRSTAPRGFEPDSGQYPQLAGLDVLTDTSVVNSPLSGAVFQAAQFFDNGFGAVAQESNRDLVEKRSQIALYDTADADRWTRKRWFYGLRGRDTAFWVPTWKDDLELQEEIGASETQIDVKKINDDASKLVGRGILIIHGDSHYARTISAASITGETMTITLSSSTGQVVPQAEGTISLMSKVRLDTDRISFAHSATGDGTLSQMQATIVEVPE